MNDMKLGAAYIRVSTAEQAELSPDSQLKMIMDYAKHNNIILSNDHIYSDEGISGRNAEKRPAFQKMISMAKQKPRPFDVILVWKFSRFARNREDSIVYKSMLRKQCGIDVISISEPMGEDNTAVLMEALFEAMDEYYSLNLAQEVKRGMHEKISRGGIIGKPPLGYIVKDGIFVPEPQEAEIVKGIFEDYLRGVPIIQIAINLNALGVTSKNGKLFNTSRIRYILSNPVYIGKLQYSLNSKDLDGIVNGQHLPIISDEMYEAVQNKLSKTRSHYPKNYKRTKTDYYFKGLVRCSNCGATLVRGHERYLQCCKYARGQCEVSHNIKIDKLKEITLDALQQVMLPQATINFVPNDAMPKSNPKNNGISLQLRKEYQKLERINYAFEEGIDTIDEYKTKKAKILATIDTLKSMLAEAEPPTASIDNFKMAVSKVLSIISDPTVSPHIYNEALYSVVDKIVFDRRKNTFDFFYKNIIS